MSAQLHEILTGLRPDGTAFAASMDRTCGNWTSSGAGSAEVGYFGRAGEGDNQIHGTRHTVPAAAAGRRSMPPAAPACYYRFASTELVASAERCGQDATCPSG